MTRHPGTPGDFDPHDSRWTLDSLHEHLSKLIEANDKRYTTMLDSLSRSTKDAMDSADKALTKAEGAAEKRFDSVNEFRETLRDQQQNLMPKAEALLLIRTVEAKVDALTAMHEAQRNSGAGVKIGWALALGVLAILCTVLAVMLSLKP